jgi:hypothetical protein
MGCFGLFFDFCQINSGKKFFGILSINILVEGKIKYGFEGFKPCSFTLSELIFHIRLKFLPFAVEVFEAFGDGIPKLLIPTPLYVKK